MVTPYAFSHVCVCELCDTNAMFPLIVGPYNKTPKSSSCAKGQGLPCINNALCIRGLSIDCGNALPLFKPSQLVNCCLTSSCKPLAMCLHVHVYASTLSCFLYIQQSKELPNMENLHPNLRPCISQHHNMSNMCM